MTKKKLVQNLVPSDSESILSADLLPLVFNFDDDFFKNQSVNISYPNYLDYLNDFCESNIGGLRVLHLNVNSLFLKCYEIKQIVELNLFDIISLNETKLDESIPNSFFLSKHYRILRRDRVKNGGGIMVLIKNNIVVISSQIAVEFEAISLKLNCNNTECNVLCVYKPPTQKNSDFLDFLDRYLKATK